MSIKQSEYSYPTAGQLERDISQKINALYHKQLAHRAKKVNCHLLDNKIIIFSEEVVTPLEKVLLKAPSFHLSHQIRTILDSSIKEKITELIEEIVRVRVINCIYETSIDTDSAVGVVILAASPQVRSKRTNYQGKRKNVVQFDRSRDKFSESI